MTEQIKGYSKINNALNHHINQLYDECFNDLSLVSQRLIKAFVLKYSKDAYVHRPRKRVPDMKIWRNLKVNEDDQHFSPDSIQTQCAQSIVNDIIGEFSRGKSGTAKYLRYFLKDKKVKVSVHKSLGYDASMDGYNPVTKEIYIDLCAGCFFTNGKNAELINRDTLAVTVGHELGHAVEKLHRPLVCEPADFSSNGWEVESFCDIFGYRLATDAGYSLQSRLDYYQKYSQEESLCHSPYNPHPSFSQRLTLVKLAKRIFRSENRPLTPFDAKVRVINWNVELENCPSLKEIVAVKSDK